MKFHCKHKSLKLSDIQTAVDANDDLELVTTHLLCRCGKQFKTQFHRIKPDRDSFPNQRPTCNDYKLARWQTVFYRGNRMAYDMESEQWDTTNDRGQVWVGTDNQDIALEVLAELGNG